jgi:hypothetical protein
MLEVKNKSKSPIQIIVRSRTAPRAFTTLNIPGVGANKNIVYLQDEQVTEYIERVEKETNLISTRYITKRDLEELKKGE